MDSHGSDPADAHAAWADLDGDRVIDTRLIDVDGDGHFDVQYTDTNHDGVADVALVDHNHDGVADVQVFSDQAGHGVVMQDHNGDGVADQIYSVGPFDVGSGTHATHATHGTHSGQSAPTHNSNRATSSVSAGPFPVGGDTGAVLNHLDSQMHDAGLIFRDAMNPGSVDPHEVQAASQRTHNAAQNAQMLAGRTYEQRVSNEIHRDDLDRHYRDEASQQATDTSVEADRLNSRAEWDVWNSQRERGA